MPSVDIVHARTMARYPRLQPTSCAFSSHVKPKLVTMFASRDRDHIALNRAMRERLPKVRA